MRDSLVFVGGGAHLSVAVEAARLSGFKMRGVLDSALDTGSTRAGLPVLGGDEKIDALLAEGWQFHISVTEPATRAKLRAQLEKRQAALVTLIHPRASVSETAEIGAGCFLAAGAIVCPGAVLGRGVVLNTGAQVDHDCRIGDDCHIAPGAILAGTVTCGEQCFIASGAVVAPNITIGSRCIVGAGSVVLENIERGTKVIGKPARATAT